MYILQITTECYNNSYSCGSSPVKTNKELVTRVFKASRSKERLEEYAKNLERIYPHIVHYSVYEVDEIADDECTMLECREYSNDEYYPTDAYSCSKCMNIVIDGVPKYCPKCGRKVSGVLDESDSDFWNYW